MLLGVPMATWISVMEAARLLKVSHQTVHNWLAAAKLKGKKLEPFGFQVVSLASVERARARR